MTRARHSLAIFQRADIISSLAGSLEGPALLHRDFIEGKLFPKLPPLNYATLGMADINLGFAGQFDQGNRIHLRSQN